jgi:hypothetical protein
MDGTGIRYDKPLSLNDQLLIDTVTHRYEGVETTFEAIDKGDHILLTCPPTIQRAIPWDSRRQEVAS